VLGHLCICIVNRVNLDCGDLEETLDALAFAVSVVLGITGNGDDHLGGVALWAVHVRYQMYPNNMHMLAMMPTITARVMNPSITSKNTLRYSRSQLQVRPWSQLLLQLMAFSLLSKFPIVPDWL
jgi:hypothetical protein